MLRRVIGQIFKGGAAAEPVSHTPAAPERAAPSRKAVGPAAGIDTDALIRHAAERVVDRPGPEVEEGINELATRFQPPAAAATADLNVFVFHVEMGEAGKLSYRDLTMDVGRFDYEAILQTFKACVRRWHPAAVTYLVTTPGSPLRALQDERFQVVELDIPAEQPMYQRVRAMCAYVRSAAFSRNTLFLDSDAFLNADFGPYLEADFDVAITVRNTPGLMPVNEGVIVARSARPPRVRSLFDRYLGTYERLMSDPAVAEYYGDIRKWRGGQLSLNAATRNAFPYSAQRRIKIGDALVQCLPCDPFNYSYEYGQNVASQELKGKTVIHLKGGRKQDLRSALAAIDGELAPAAQPSPAPSAVSIADRKYSLDTTFPEEFVPTSQIDYRKATLTELADYFRTDKGSIKHRYTEVYSQYLESRRGTATSLLEIGVACGSSLKMWEAYLGPSSRITGIDIREECSALCRDRPNIQIVIGDAAQFVPDGMFDVIVDDGSHVSKDIVAAWSNLWSRVPPGGLYIVEDLRCTHDQSYKSNFTFPKADDDFDRRHVMNWLDKLMRSMDYGQSDIDFVHVYRQLIVMGKKI